MPYIAKNHYIVSLVFLFIALAPVSGQDRKASEEKQSDALPNFGRVSERLYRGGQPGEGGFKKLATLGVNTVINLRDDDERSAAEAEEVRAAGLQYFNVPFKRLGRPIDSDIDHVLSLINAKENGIVFVHCKRGHDRTGTVIAVYRISHDGWTDQDAKREAERFGMKFWQRGMKDFISDYYRDRSRRAVPAGNTPPPPQQ
jgi:protein tyrosine/serine phosphatase